MKSKNLIILLLTLFAIMNIHLHCDKEYDGIIPENKYAFREKVTISPYQLDYNVGDTTIY